MGEVNPTMLNPEDDDFDLEDESDETDEEESSPEADQEEEETTATEEPSEEAEEDEPEASEEEPSEESPQQQEEEGTEFEPDYGSQTGTVEEGDLLEGEVVQVRDDEVFVDFGWQSEGVVPEDHLMPDSLEEGDAVLVKILDLDREENMPLLSNKAALAERAWNKAREAFEKGRPVEGRIFKEIKGGFLVKIFGGLTAFMPGSHLSTNKVDDTDRFLDQSFNMQILEYDRDDDNVVVSRRKYLEEQERRQKKSFFDQHDSGDWVEGTVKNIVEFGAFVNLGPVDGLLHVSDVAWGQVREVSNHVEEGDELEVQILSLDAEESQVSLGLKQKYPDPWEEIRGEYEEGQVTTGEIVDVWDDGVFVRLEEEVEGKVDETELAWIQSWKHPKDQFHVGEKLDVKILEIDEDRRSIQLSHKRTKNNPWTILQERFPEGTVLKAPVVDIHKDHLNVQLLKNVQGIIRDHNISWEDEEVDLYESFTLNEKIKCKILELDPDEQRVELGVKQTTPDPWVQKARNHPPGTTLEGEVTNVLQFGAFVEIEDGLEGLVHVSEMAEGKRVNPHEVVSEGDTVGVKVLDIDEDEHKVDLSIQAYQKEQQREEVEEYIDDEPDEDSDVTMGEVLGEDLDNLMGD
jgi:small subunit ribosomal protein S1